LVTGDDAGGELQLSGSLHTPLVGASHVCPAAGEPTAPIVAPTAQANTAPRNASLRLFRMIRALPEY
jgi:hypothetical protein